MSMQSADTLYLAFVPSNYNDLPDSHFELHIVNDTRLTVLYAVSFTDGERHEGVAAGHCAPDTASAIGTYSLKEVDKVKAFHVQAIFYQKGRSAHSVSDAILSPPASLPHWLL